MGCVVPARLLGNHKADCMDNLGFKLCSADQDVWMCAATRPNDGFEYMEYVLLYVDDVLVVSHDGMAILDKMDKFFRMKEGSKGSPDIPSKYVQEAVHNVKEYLGREYDGRTLLKSTPTAFVKDYRPELDISEELGSEEASYYQSQIGILRWMVGLGRVDIITEVSILASQRWQCPGKEAIPTNVPTARGKEVDVHVFCDSDHTGVRLTRRSRTGYLIYLNMSSVAWQSKKQATVESSVFGAEFVVMKVGMEMCHGLRYKLRMMGVPISGPTYIYGDNMSVLIHNTQ
eukprot:scaffold11251_cov50-Attheya_sp.AAC.1